MGRFSAERAANDARIVLDQLLGEVWVLEGPEAQQARLLLAVVGDVDVALSVADGNQVWIGQVDVDAGDAATLSQVTLESEEWLQVNLALFDFFFLLLVVVFLLGFLLDAHGFFW